MNSESPFPRPISSFIFQQVFPVARRKGIIDWLSLGWRRLLDIGPSLLCLCSPAALAGQELAERRFAAELAQPVVGVFLQQRDHRSGRTRLRPRRVAPAGESIGIPNVAVDGLRPDHAVPPAEWRGRSRRRPTAVLPICGSVPRSGRRPTRLVGKPDGKPPMLHHSRQPRWCLPGVEHHGGGPRKLAGIDRRRQEIQHAQSAPLQSPGPTPRPTMPVACSRL